MRLQTLGIQVPCFLEERSKMRQVFSEIDSGIGDCVVIPIVSRYVISSSPAGFLPANLFGGLCRAEREIFLYQMVTNQGFHGSCPGMTLCHRLNYG